MDSDECADYKAQIEKEKELKRQAKKEMKRKERIERKLAKRELKKQAKRNELLNRLKERELKKQARVIKNLKHRITVWENHTSSKSPYYNSKRESNLKKLHLMLSNAQRKMMEIFAREKV